MEEVSRDAAMAFKKTTRLSLEQHALLRVTYLCFSAAGDDENWRQECQHGEDR
jgi:hypothetical protein